MTTPFARATLHHAPDQRFAPSSRHWQGIPGIERSPGGRLWATHYTGGIGEGIGNHCVLCTSDDDGATWRDPVVVVEPAPGSRCFDPCLWLDPSGRLWWFWAECEGKHYDGRPQTWAAVADEPDAAQPTFSAPRWIHPGIMMNKPTVTTAGEWLLPCAVWSVATQVADSAAYRYSGAVVSTDAGATFSWRGGADVPERTFDEHMFIERRDGSLQVLVRTRYGVGESSSQDGGRTWSPGKPSVHEGPNSRFYIRRLASGRLLMVNHGNRGEGEQRHRTRSHLTAWLSDDDGATWQGGLCLDDRQPVSYPDGTQAPDGRIYVIYDYARGDKHWSVDGGGRQTLLAVFTEADILAGTPSPGTRLRLPVSQATG